MAAAVVEKAFCVLELAKMNSVSLVQRHLVYQRQSFRSSTSGKFKRTETTHHNKCCKCWQGYVQVCLDRIRLSYWYLSCDKRLTHRTFV